MRICVDVLGLRYAFVSFAAKTKAKLVSPHQTESKKEAFFLCEKRGSHEISAAMVISRDFGARPRKFISHEGGATSAFRLISHERSAKSAFRVVSHETALNRRFWQAANERADEQDRQVTSPRKSETQNPRPETRIQKPESRDLKPRPETRNPNPETQDPRHENYSNLNPKPKNPRTEARDPQIETLDLRP